MDPDTVTPETGPLETGIPRDVSRRISRAVGVSFIGLVLERGLQAFWAFGSLCLLLLSALLLSLPDAVPRMALIVAGGLWSFLAVWALASGVLRLRVPSLGDARARVDASLEHQPLQALRDTPVASGSGASDNDLWRTHIARMIEIARAAAPVAPDLRLSSRDPYALRLMALTMFAMAILFGTAQFGQGDGPHGNDAKIALGPNWEGWVEPPAYTGKPSLYLADLSDEFAVPEGSAVTIRLYGAKDALRLRQTVSRAPAAPDISAHQFRVETGGEIEIDGPTGRLWFVVLAPDAPPVASLVGDMTRAPMGEARQSFLLGDDFGVARASLTITVDAEAIWPVFGYARAAEPRAPIEVTLPLPQTGDRRDIKGVLAENFSLHPFSGLPVRLSLQAWDAAGQSSEASLGQAILPGRRFFDPLAAALIDLRREMLWNRANAPRAAQVMRAVTYVPDGLFGDDPTLMSRIKSVVFRIEGSSEPLADDLIDGLAQELWDVAVLLEDGELSEALERLRRAQDRLSQAMRDGATPEEIATLMQELRDATRDYMRQLAEQQDADNDGAPPSENSREMTADQLQQLMDRIQELMEQGRMAEAQQLMEMLNEMLENMQVTKSQGGGEGQQAMEGLQDMLRDQQQLNDDTFSDLQDQFSQDQTGPQGGARQNEGGQKGDGQPQSEGPLNGEETTPRGSLADRQQALRDELDRQKRQMPLAGSGEEDGAGTALQDADRAMNEAEEALRNDDFSSALDSQAEAMEALREGMRQLGRQMAEARQNQEGRQGESGGQSGDAERRDPLGRTEGESGQLGTDEGLYDGENANRRAQDLLDELRRRSAQQERPDQERDYLNRLLDRF